MGGVLASRKYTSLQHGDNLLRDHTINIILQ